MVARFADTIFGAEALRIVPPSQVIIVDFRILGSAILADRYSLCTTQLRPNPLFWPCFLICLALLLDMSVCPLANIHSPSKGDTAVTSLGRWRAGYGVQAPAKIRF